VGRVKRGRKKVRAKCKNKLGAGDPKPSEEIGGGGRSGGTREGGVTRHLKLFMGAGGKETSKGILVGRLRKENGVQGTHPNRGERGRFDTSNWTSGKSRTATEVWEGGRESNKRTQTQNTRKGKMKRRPLLPTKRRSTKWTFEGVKARRRKHCSKDEKKSTEKSRQTNRSAN